MPDGDIVHSKLRKLYQKPYKWLCEGKATNDECARVLLEQLKQDIKAKGDLPVVLAQIMAARLIQATNVDELGVGTWATLSIEFDRLVQRSDGRSDLKELILRAVKSVLRDLRYGQEINVSHAPVVILERYINEVYESEFKERVPLTPKHYAGIDQATLSERIEEIQPDVKVGINKFAKDAIRKQSVAQISLPRRLSRKPINLDEDLLAG
ncbi:hypothetical protein Q2T42_21925 [Leptolyngbya boryana CZ1]|uniref:Uncharacterized protein n=1 Tax=Leptolyngbya boryana CZ1 TaxID=3060204 RepID=A0AA96WRW5_LEPBY|nr:hypothetical protein [Leptolyngbya boryana]WNZ44462.1 hypothetical protein Q2T42_21925 [Leptolyngbya boryana CZ1]